MGRGKKPRAKPRGRGPRIQERRSRATGEVYLYGDFRGYADVGGGVEALRPEGARHATSDPAMAAALYAKRLRELRALRERSASDTAIMPAPTPDAPAESGPTSMRLHVASDEPTNEGATAAGARQRLRLSEMIELHVTRKALPRSGRRASTVARDRQNLRVVMRLMGDCFLDEVTSSRCDAYVMAREREPGVRPGTTVAARTINNELNSLSNCFKRAIAMGFVAANPVRSMAERPAIVATEAEFLTTTEVAALLDAAVEMDAEARRAQEAADLRVRAKALGDARRNRAARSLRALARTREGGAKPRHPNVYRQWAHLEALLATYLYTGGRLHEVLGLLVEDVDFANGRVAFRRNEHRPLKRDRHKRSVPLWLPLEILLREHLRATGVSEGLVFRGRRGMLRAVQAMLKRVLRRAGFPASRRISPHTLRHTYATQLLQTLVRTDDGKWALRSSFQVALLLGHRSSALVDDVYGHLVQHPRYRETLSYEEERRHPASRLVGGG